MRRRFKKYMVLCLAAMLLCIGPAPAIRADSGGESGTAVKKAVQSPSPSYRGSNEPEGMKLAAENDYLALYIDERETDVAVAVKASGDIWYSNPPAALEDEGASAYYQKQMKSQISLTYFNANMQSSEMDNYNDSILGEQFEILYGVNGVTVVYTMGKAEGALLIPYAIRADRMDGYLARMEESAAKKVKRNYTLLDGSSLSDSEKAEYLKLYPALETQSVYVLKSGAKDYVKEELSAYFEAAGYSAQERDKDAQELGIASEDDKPWFKIPLQYTLEEDNLLVTVDPGAIEYNTDGYYLAELDLMKYFGAAGADEEGYLFVPDGSGALINLNNGKTGAASYSAAVYGQDKTMNFMKPFKSEADESLAVKMPVFGLKAGNRAWFAIIEEGDGYGEIHAEISGVTNSYNNAYASFSYLRYGPVAVSEMIGSNSFQMYSRPVFEGKYALRYAFLSGEASDYSGMAEIYRNYMIGKGWLKQKLTQESASFFVEFVGAIEKYKSFLAVKYRAQEALTTFSQAAAIVSELKESGVGGIKVKYSGWSGGGLKGNAVTDTGVASC